ncbi:hypothetical protein [Leptothoe spongobia]|uniref:Uncharacterized protein n=1 Tax=Leptothoe spongobia TAU-MAC 1115 TaxID=1967444 RepID=A0A947GMB4_9CYAN|nr:hypothetical protein [Leptothoe spongobia]MBT9317562.1 hypothetical protein [Leptothoe spongobia TAU-MAC 1115]
MSTSKVPQLPLTDDNEASSLRYEVNPAIALNALTDIYKQVQQYQVQLRHLAQNIHQVYAEGPVVSGWLASEASLNAAVKHSPAVKHVTPAASSGSCHLSTEDIQVDNPLKPQQQLEPHQSPNEIDVALFRHGDANDLMNYLSALESSMLEQGASDDEVASSNSQSHQPSSEDIGNPSQYYLCQLDSSGQIQAESCPPEQVPVLSMAIARYRRLNQLIKQKQEIETKLQAVVDILGDAQRVLTD